MDWTVYPNTRVADLPRPLRPPALLARNIAGLRRPRYVYEDDGLATVHYTPFLEGEKEFSDLYWRIESEWMPPGLHLDLRWRSWILTRLARHASHLSGNFAEFGSGRGGCAALILSTCRLAPGRHFFLFDTFSGIPESRLTAGEKRKRFAGLWGQNSREHVESFLSEWQDVVEICEGDVFETLPATDTGSLSFVHVDLNASAPTKLALEYAYPRLVEGAIMVLDDYGWRKAEDQRQVIDEFFDSRPEDVMALPTGQALVIRTPQG
jgi:O-methyltransferase